MACKLLVRLCIPRECICGRFELEHRAFPCFGLVVPPSWRYIKRVRDTVRTPTLSVQFNRVNDPESIMSFTLKCYKIYYAYMPFSPRGIEQSLVLPPRWPLILYTGTLYCVPLLLLRNQDKIPTPTLNGLSHLKSTPLCGRIWNTNQNQCTKSFQISKMLGKSKFQIQTKSMRNGVEEIIEWIASWNKTKER